MTRVPESAKRFDLHMHSTRSDGRYEPEQVLQECARVRLDVVSLTDHDLSTVNPGEHTIDGHTVTVIAGAELSGLHDGREYHLLVYFPGDVPPAFADFCRARAAARAERYEKALDRLALPDLAPPDEAAREGDRAITRHHLARALVEAGHASNTRDAFDRFVGSRHKTVPHVELPFVDAIRIARGFGGITSWAHPPPDAVKAHLETFVAAGLHGLEGHRPGLRRQTRHLVRKCARTHGLLVTGGSDWHGWGADELGLFVVYRDQIEAFLDALSLAA